MSKLQPKSMSNNTLIQFSDIGYSAGKKNIVTDISFAIEKEQIVTVIGPNGSGKSTIAKLLLQIIHQTTGTIQRSKGIRIGYVPQHFALESNIPLLVKDFLRLYVKSNTNDIQELSQRMGCETLQNKMLYQVSGGEMQRVLLTRALLAKPQLLVLDEPTQGLDVQSEHDYYNLLNSIKTQLHCSVLLISHDLHLVMASTDIVICLNGHICCQGAPVDIQKNQSFLSLFGKKTHLTLAGYHHDHSHVH